MLNHSKHALVFVFLAGILFGAVAVYSLTPSTAITISSGIWSYADYIIWKEGTNYFSKNSYGENTFSGTSETTVIQNCIDALTYGWIIVKEIKIPLAVTFKQGVIVQEVYKGTITEYPFPRNMGDWFSLPLHYMGVFAFENGYYVLKYNKDLWVNSAETNFGCETARGCTAEVDTERYYGTYQWKYYHAGNETGKIFATGLAWTGMCTVQGAYFQQNADGTLITDTALDTNIEQQAVTDAEWDVNTESTLKIDWDASSVKFYVNDVLVNTHTTRVPNAPMQFLFEIDHNAHAGDYTYHSYMYVKDFRSYIDG